MSKVEILGERAWLIRSVKTKKDDIGIEHKTTRYYIAPAMWSKNPMQATIFQEKDAAAGHINMYDKRDRPKKGWADGSIEELDVANMYEEIVNGPNGVHISIKRNDDGTIDFHKGNDDLA
jgi:hypothetical protein